MNVIRPPQPVLDKRGEPHVRRFEAQRWLLDNVIRANGIDWDQPRSLYLSGPCGNEANADFAGIRERVKKMADIGPAFEAVARRREAKAKAAEEADRRVTARDNYFMAAVQWGAAQWPYDQNNETNIAYNNKKRECYAKYAALADHHVEAVWVPFRDKAIPAWFHLPPGYNGGRIPAVIAVPGMDSFKEIQVALYGDRFLNRGMAVLAIDGPGQYEAPMIGLHFTMENWMAAGPVLVDWIAARPELDASRIGVAGTSFGSLSLRNRATSADSRRRIASSAARRTEADGSSAACLIALSPMPASAMTPACRRFGSASAFCLTSANHSGSRPSTAGVASASPDDARAASARPAPRASFRLIRAVDGLVAAQDPQGGAGGVDVPADALLRVDPDDLVTEQARPELRRLGPG